MCSKRINHNPSRREFLGAAAAVLGAPALSAQTVEAGDLARRFRDMPNSCRMRMHWYVFGPAWTADEGERQLRQIADAHLGGVLIFPAYPIAVDDPARGIRNQKYLSPEFLDVLRAAVRAAQRLDLTADIVLGTGWPYGGPSVGVEDSSHAIRMLRATAGSEPPALAPDERMIAAFLVDGDSFRRIELAERPAGPGEIQIFYATPTRMEVKRASVGAEGLVVDHYNRAALERYLEAVGDKLLGALPAGAIRSIFCDSLEVYRATWTSELPRIFRERRGYDLTAHLPALFGRNHPDYADLRCDFWRTLSAQAAEAFVEPLVEWAHRKGVTAQVESYGTPPVSIASYRTVDVPVGEHYEWKEFNSSRWASSGGHLAGKPVILAEAWTWLGLPNRFADTLEQLKLCSDLHFLSGINALYGLTYAYSPMSLGSPGWVPYFGPATNHTSPYWPYFSHLVDYVNRASFILQQGKPVADIAVYLPVEDAMAEASGDQLLLNWAVRDRLSSNGPPPEFSLANALHYESDVVKTIITNGYAFDGIDTFTLNGGMRAESGRLVMGDGHYAVLVLPNLTGIDVESLEKIEQFVAGGGVVIATLRLPERAYGLRDRERRNARAKEVAGRLFGADHGRASRAILCADERGSFLAALRAHPPDIAWSEPSPHVSFVHRRSADRDFYFIANTSETPQKLEGAFRVGRRQPELWDLRTGEIEPLVVFEHTSGRTRVPFELGPRQSKVIVFAEGSRAPVATRTNLPLTARGARVFANGSYFAETAAGRKQVRVTGIPAPYTLAPRWTLALDEKRFTLDELKSWTEIPEARFFSGRGVYEAEFETPDFAGLGVVLDLGAVRETADVQVNERQAGVAGLRPYQLDITDVVRPGANRLRVVVANLLINQILGLGPIDYSAVYAQYGRRFPAGDEWTVIRDPLPSGLLGPVRLLFYKVVQP